MLPSARPPTPNQGHDYPADVMAMLTDPVQLCTQLGLVRDRRGLIRCPDPGHVDMSPSAYVIRHQGSGKIMWKCHSCKRGGSVLSLIAMVYGLDIRSDFREVLAIGAELGGDLS